MFWARCRRKSFAAAVAVFVSVLPVARADDGSALQHEIRIAQATQKDAAAAGTWATSVAPKKSDSGISAMSVSLSQQDTSTTFSLVLSRGVRVEVFTLANPYRVIVDLPDVAFDLPDGTGKTGWGLVKAFRYGVFEAGKARIVLDTTGPVLISKAEMNVEPTGKGVRLAVVMAPTEAAAFGTGTGAQKTSPPASKPSNYEDDRPAKPKDRAKPVILVDPGHGGIDPGAVAATNVLEKNVVLAVAKLVKARLAANGRYDVHMTRQTDAFVSLDQRLKKSREHDADLFISIHADSIESVNFAQSVRGASVYTLSDKASDEQARQMAAKENASDLLAGLDSSEVEGKDEVKNILIDLMRRETSDFSSEFSNLLVGRLKKSIPMSREPRRSAAFKVLRQTESPSVLIELGYLSNSEDEKAMTSEQWQAKVARSISEAVDAYFTKRTAGGP